MNAHSIALPIPPILPVAAAREFVSVRSLVALCVGAAVLLAACGREGGGAAHGGPGGPGGMPPPEVAVVTVQSKTIPATFEYTGQTSGYREVEVRSRVAGILLKRNFTEGALVTQGQSLYGIDSAPFVSALARAEADTAAAEARLAQARRNAARLKPLYEANAVSQKEFDDAVSAEQVADADLKSARARTVDARLNVDYTRVESPIAGITGRSLNSEGTLVSGPAVLLTTVSQVDPIYVNFGIAEAEHLKLRNEAAAGRLILPKGGKFDVSVKQADGSPYGRTGKLSFSDVRISTVTGTSDARAELPNPEGVLRTGQFVHVTLSGASRPNAILVPQRAVLEGPGGKFVYVVNKESKAEPHPVVVGDWVGDAWIIVSGLSAGDQVIVDGVMRIGPGAPVRIADPNAPKAPMAGPPGGAPAGAPAGASGDGAKGDASKAAQAPAVKPAAK